MIFCGIDPGLSGAVGFITEGGMFAGVVDMPVLPTTTGRRAIDPAGLADVLRQHGPCFVMVERVGPRPGEGASGAFSFGQTYGAILAVLAALCPDPITRFSGIPHDVVQPATWKRRAGIPPGADKACSVTTAKRLLPEAGTFLTRIKDDGRAESLLLAIDGWQRRNTTKF